MNWKERLYQKYVSSGQASIRTVNFAEHFAKFKPYAQYLINRCIPKDKSIKIEDLGCGSGGYLYHLQQNGYQNVSGVDVSEEQVNFANSAGLDQVSQGNLVEYLSGMPANSVDVILLMDVIEHLTRQELFDCMDLVFSRLKKGGKVIVHVPNAEGLFGNRIRYGDLTHELAFTPYSISQLGKTIGFSTIRCYEDKPIVKSLIGAIRRFIWELGTLHYRLLFAAETGSGRVIFSQNMLAELVK